MDEKQPLIPWTALRAIGNSTAVKMTIFIPVIGYMVLFNEYILHYLALSSHIFGSTEIQSSSQEAHVSWRLVLLYFGFCFLAGGAAIYQFFCPAEVKEFGTPIDYISAMRPQMGDVMFGRLESTLSKHKNCSKEFTQFQKHMLDRQGRYSQKADRDEIFEAYKRDVLELNFRSLNASSPILRMVTAAFYVVGSIILAIPSLNVFWKVTEISIPSLFALL